MTAQDTASSRVAATRRRLLDAALAAFARRGLHDTRIEDVCTNAGIARATFYRHFEGKSELVLALHDEMADQLFAISEALEPVTPDAEGLETLGRWVDAMLTLSERWAPITASLSESSEAGSEVRRRSVAVTGRFSQQVGRRFAEGAVLGVDPAMAALAIIALIDGVGHQMRTWSLDVERADVVDLLTLQALAMLHPGFDVGGGVVRRHVRAVD